MDSATLSGSTEISNEGIKKHFKNIEPCDAVFQLVWNGFDANAKTVEIFINENEMHSVEKVIIFDDGDGIDIRNIKDNFGRFNDSFKKEDIAQHGFHGRGRLTFHKLCDQATWFTKSKETQAILNIDSNNIKEYSGVIIENDSQHKLLTTYEHGTCVELINIHTNLPETKELEECLSVEFGWYLLLNSDRNLKINGKNISVPAHELHSKDFTINDYTFNVKIIRWEQRPSSEKSNIYLLNSLGKTLYKQLSSFNNKPLFFVSIYINSSWADSFQPTVNDLFTRSDAHNIDSEEWKKLLKKIADYTQTIYDDFLRRLADKEIEKYINDGIFPEYDTKLDKAYIEWRLNHTKTILKSIYTADPSVFSGLNKKQKKIIVRFLDKLLISNENDSLFNVLNSILDLDNKSIEMLANQLQRTTLENIISTIEIIQHRQSVIDKLRELMNLHYREVLETPDLQKIIENNTWLFGSRYETLGAEEDTFKKIALSLRNQIKGINDIDIDDLDEDEKSIVQGAQKQTDLFLARKFPIFDSFGNKIYKCVIIEIKRPSISLNFKHLRQLDDYARIIQQHNEFMSEKMHFELILVGRKISSKDIEIRSRLNNQVSKGEMGLVSEDPRMKRYVLNWYTILDGFELTYDFMLDKLRLKRDYLTNLPKEELIKDLQDGYNHD